MKTQKYIIKVIKNLPDKTNGEDWSANTYLSRTMGGLTATKNRVDAALFDKNELDEWLEFWRAEHKKVFAGVKTIKVNVEF